MWLLHVAMNVIKIQSRDSTASCPELLQYYMQWETETFLEDYFFA